MICHPNTCEHECLGLGYCYREATMGAVIIAARVALSDYDAHRKGSERPSMEALRHAMEQLP